MELPKLTNINNNVIDLIETQQTLCSLTYSLEPVELETLKTYIKIWPIDLCALPSHKLEMWSYFFIKKTETIDYMSTLVTPITWLSKS